MIRFLFLASLLVFAHPATAVVSQSDILGDGACYQGDALNRLTQTTYPDGTTRSVAYRPDGRKQSETDQNGNTVQYGYDPLGRIAQVTLDANGASAVTAYAYDEAGNKVSQTDAEGSLIGEALSEAGCACRTLPGRWAWSCRTVGNARFSAIDKIILNHYDLI
jgi:YD repeat-containing protein